METWDNACDASTYNNNTIKYNNMMDIFSAPYVIEVYPTRDHLTILNLNEQYER